MHPKGLIEIELESGKRHLKFGTLSFNIFCQLEKIPLGDLHHRLNNPEPFTLINFLFAAASAYCRIANIEIDFNVDSVACWLDEIEEAKVLSMMEESFASYQPKKKMIQKDQEEMKSDGIGTIASPLPSPIADLPQTTSGD